MHGGTRRVIYKLRGTVPLYHELEDECVFLVTIDCNWCLTSYNEGLRVLLFYSQSSSSTPLGPPCRRDTAIMPRRCEQTGQAGGEVPPTQANCDASDAGNAAEDVNGIQGAEKVAYNTEWRQEGDVDDHHGEHEERREEIRYDWIRENKRREGPSCGVVNK